VNIFTEVFQSDIVKMVIEYKMIARFEMNNRQQALLDLLENRRAIKIKDVMTLMMYSESTIRRDVRYLQEKVPIKIENGTLILVPDDLVEIETSFKNVISYKEKQIISEYAIDFVEDYASIYMDSSSTCTVFATQFGKKSHLKVFTNNFVTATNTNSVQSNHLTYLLGGMFDKGICGGEFALNNLKDIYVDVAFISCRGFHKETGMTEIIESEACIKKQLATHADKIILLLDGTKFDKRYTFKSLPFENLAAVITNKAPDQDYIDFFEKNDIELIF